MPQDVLDSESSPGGSSPEEASEDFSFRQLRRSSTRRSALILLLILSWTYAYNLLIKGQPPLEAFFEILNTISDDFVMGSLLTFLVGLGIVLVYGLTKFYSQIISNVYSFRILERIAYRDLPRGDLRSFLRNLIYFEEQPEPKIACPHHISSIVLSFAMLYAVSWTYLVLFSEALFFLAWSAGVNLVVREDNVLIVPTVAMAIPFSARVMAYFRYPYTQDFADFMPGVVFVLLIVYTLGRLYDSPDERFFLLQVMANQDYLNLYLRNGVFLAFLPVFFEAIYWMIELRRLEMKANASSNHE
ncbi:Hypothetical protein PBC10988_33730 [Planctomycetales bacterium 10988]|nr:Hypothetical protein PBC10988_33730 [Planctomycetales bacterium 10988]